MIEPRIDARPAQLVTIVEDDAAIAEGLAMNLRLQGYRTESIADGETARTRIEDEQPALVLLDISLPKRSGLWVLERLREADNHVPVIVLSARQDEFDKVAALRLGADDYVTKPFALAELLARVAALLRRARLTNPERARAGTTEPQTASAEASTPPPVAVATGAAATAAAGSDSDSQLRFGDVTVDLDTRTVLRSGQEVKLTHREFELLRFFYRSGGRVFSRRELVREVWGLDHLGHPRTVDNFMGQLRAKLEGDPDRPRHFLTVRGSGYRFVQTG
jgi:two-component system, OmpR family, alkaline phosphatase synthesis response regulator PhoP